MPRCINWGYVYLSKAKATQIIGSVIYLSISDKRDKSLNPFAKGLLSIFNFVICKKNETYWPIESR